MIIASNFLEKTKTSDQIGKASVIFTTPRNPAPPDKEARIILYLKRLANAKVVLPLAFTVRKSEPLKDDAASKDYDNVERLHELTLSKHKVKALENVKQDLVKHDVQYTRDISRALEQAEAAHTIEVDKVKEDYLKKLKIGGSRNEPIVEVEEELTMKVPDFNFKYQSPFSPEYLQTLSSDVKDFVINKNLEEATVQSAVQAIDKEVKTISKLASTQLKVPNSIIIANGNIIKKSTSDLYCFTLSFSTSENIKSLNNALYLSIIVNYKRAFLVSSEYTVSINDQRYSGTGADLIYNSGTLLMVRLFPKAEMKINDKAIFRFNCTLLLNNGVRLGIDVKGLLENKMTSGCAVVLQEDGQATEGNPLYGVNRVGIVDYRKVEQEVCCYVPGEVSHIENILAKEYKERHTRNLTSTESVLEETFEVEIENQTDTATTERNELQSEVATVLSEDNSRNYGASAGASGKYLGAEVTTDGYADFASSNASSDSNSSAKTYAEEVTLRALERVVQKTTEKRTSRILKEYEENIRHGYDNRTGDKHVTGVFRWLDKIYTNRLVNYGKRLMYEFMVPEPARFYKKAIIKQVDSEENIVTLEEPVHPSDLDAPVNTAFDIDETNYQSLASIYGAQIPAPPARETTVSKTYNQSPDKKEFSHSYDDIYIPANYQTKKATGTLSFDWEAKPPLK